MRDFTDLTPSSNIRTGVAVSSGGAHGIAFLAALRSLNQSGHLKNLHAMSGASAGAVISAIIGSSVNEGLLKDGHRGNISHYIEEGARKTNVIFRQAAVLGQLVRHPGGKFLKPFFEAYAEIMPDHINQWHLQKLPPHLNQNAVAEGPIDVLIGTTIYEKNGQARPVTISNLVTPEVIAASCALNRPIKIEDQWHSDGGFTKAAPVRDLILESGCNHIIMIGETSRVPQAARHQTQAMINDGSPHATRHFEGHAKLLQEEFPGVTIEYVGIPAPDCDISRGTLSKEHFDALDELGTKVGQLHQSKLGASIPDHALIHA